MSNVLYILVPLKNHSKDKNFPLFLRLFSLALFSNDIQNSAQIAGCEQQTYISCGAFDSFLGHDVAKPPLPFNCAPDIRSG